MKFENSDYNKIWESQEGREIFSVIVNDPSFLKPNYTFWSEKFRIDPVLTPSNEKGEATFTSKMRELVAADMTLVNVKNELVRILPAESEDRAAMLREYARMMEILGKPGASRRAAEKIVALLAQRDKKA